MRKEYKLDKSSKDMALSFWQRVLSGASGGALFVAGLWVFSILEGELKWLSLIPIVIGIAAVFMEDTVKPIKPLAKLLEKALDKTKGNQILVWMFLLLAIVIIGFMTIRQISQEDLVVLLTILICFTLLIMFIFYLAYKEKIRSKPHNI